LVQDPARGISGGLEHDFSEELVAAFKAPTESSTAEHLAAVAAPPAKKFSASDYLSQLRKKKALALEKHPAAGSTNAILARLNQDNLSSKDLALRNQRAAEFQAALNPVVAPKKAKPVNAASYLAQLRTKKKEHMIGAPNAAAKALAKLNSHLGTFKSEDDEDSKRQQRAAAYREALDESYMPKPVAHPEDKYNTAPRTKFSQQELSSAMHKLRNKRSQHKHANSRDRAAKMIESINRAQFFDSKAYKIDPSAAQKQLAAQQAKQLAQKQAEQKQTRAQQLLDAKAEQARQIRVAGVLKKLRAAKKSKAGIHSLASHSKAQAILARINIASRAEKKKVDLKKKVASAIKNDPVRQAYIAQAVKAQKQIDSANKPAAKKGLSPIKVLQYLNKLRARKNQLMGRKNEPRNFIKVYKTDHRKVFG
jgi:hypothetical protein